MQNEDNTRQGTRARHQARVWIAAALSAALAVPLTSLAASEPAVAADGQGAGQSVAVAVQSDGFSLSGVKKVNIVSSSKFKGAVRIERDNGKYCLATKGGANDGKEHGAQWTGCNGDASKAWIVEPLSTSGPTAGDDDTEAVKNLSAGNLTFVLRSWKYPKHCYFSQGKGFDGAKPASGSGRMTGITPHCDAASVAGDLSTRFGVKDDISGKETWQFLRGKMIEGAIALHQRKLTGMLAGKNLWVRPMSLGGDYVGGAGADDNGYFLPTAIVIDPAKESAILSQSSVSRGCLDNRWWWGLNNTAGLESLKQTIVTESQQTDGFSWGLASEVGLEGGAPTMKASVKITASVEETHSTSKTESRSIEMTAPPGYWALAVVTTPSINVNGLWKSGAELGREWSFGGTITIAEKKSTGRPQTNIAVVNSREQKSCSATAATTLVPGAPFRVQVPGRQIAPRVGDTVTADVSYVQPASGAPLDVRYQWFADDEEIPGQTAQTLAVTADYLGKKLRFSAYENGGPDRFESPTKKSLATAAVVVDGDAATAFTVTLPQAMLGEAYDIDLLDIDALDDNVVSVTGDLPPGISFDNDADALVGAPSALGTFEVVVQDEDGNGPVTATLEVVPQASVYPGTAGILTQVGAMQDIRLVETVAPGSTYGVEFFSGGVATGMPEGMRIETRLGTPYLVGVPTVAGLYSVRVVEHSGMGLIAAAPVSSGAPVFNFTFEVREPASIVPPVIDPVVVPDITFERITDPAAGTSVRAGQEVLWAVRASGAYVLTATVHRVNESDPVLWAMVTQTLDDELEIDGVPTEPGEYLITVLASNGAGQTATSYGFTVVPAGDNGSGSSNGGNSGSGANPATSTHDALSATGGDTPLALLALGGGVLLLGVAAVLTATVRRAQRRN